MIPKIWWKKSNNEERRERIEKVGSQAGILEQNKTKTEKSLFLLSSLSLSLHSLSFCTECSYHSFLSLSMISLTCKRYGDGYGMHAEDCIKDMNRSIVVCQKPRTFVYQMSDAK